VEIRRLTSVDAEAGHALRLRALLESPEAFGSTHEEYSALPLDEVYKRYEPKVNAFTLGAFVDEALVGVVTFQRETRIKTSHKGYVTGMFVAPEVRGRGIGRALVQQLISEARGMGGVEQIGLDVFTSTTAARSLYLSLGFVVSGMERNADKFEGVYYHSEFMVLFLN
jgi:ribosomal protein S18 acetylase RimI-like enzyme